MTGDPPGGRERPPVDRDALLATKLHRPVWRPGLVARPRLVERLDEVSHRGVALVVAPAGYGKTVLLADWTQRVRGPIAWLSLDRADNDPARFWRHLLAALEATVPGIAGRVGPLLDRRTPASVEALVTGLVNELATASDRDEIVFVLDDYHVIDDPGVHSGLSFLLEHRPPALRLVLAGRSDPPLPLARLRARGELVEARAAQLRFTDGEAGELLHLIGSDRDEPLPDKLVAALAARTEGWAAGLQLAGLSLRGHRDAAGFVAAFTGSHRHILDYLTEEVLEGQSEEVRRFLLETSVLERLGGSLCDAVTGRSDSVAVLAAIERSGLFVVPLDDVRRWWRYHHLFADLLRARLGQDPDRAAELHRRAGTWYEEHGLLDDAIHHAAGADDPGWAARLIEEHFDIVFNVRGEEATIQRWLGALPGSVVRSRPRLLLVQAQMASMRGDVTAVEPLLDAAERASAEGIDDDFEPTAGRAGSLLVNVPVMIALQRSYLAQLRNDPEETVRFAARARAGLGETDGMVGLAIEGFFGVAEWLRGRLPQAEEIFRANADRWRSADQYTGAAWADYSLARLQRAQGRLDDAEETCDRALGFTSVSGRARRPAAGPALVGLAELAYERNGLELARRRATEGVALCRLFVHTPPLAAGLVRLAWIEQAEGDHAAALASVTEAQSFSPGPPGLFNPVPAERARLLLAQGDLDGAAEWTGRCGLDPDADPAYPRQPGHLVLARLLVARRQPERALARLDLLLRGALDQSRTASIIEVQAVRALALTAAGDEEGGRAALRDALRRAGPPGYIRLFVDEGPAMAELLGRLITAERKDPDPAGLPLAYLARLHGAFQAAGPDSPPAEPVAIGLFEALTPRETEVLRMLASGSSNQAIAAELVVSVDTVKKHVSHILDKLGAGNRTEAVARARGIALIP